MKEVLVKWNEEKSMLDQFYVEKPKKGFDLRIYQTTKEVSLDNLADKIIGVLGLGISDSKFANLVISLLLIMSISPFQFKIMKGKGIDNIINKLKHDENGDFLYINKSELEDELYKNNIGTKAMDWFVDNKLFEINAGRYIFRGNRIKSAEIYQSLD